MPPRPPIKACRRVVVVRMVSSPPLPCVLQFIMPRAPLSERGSRLPSMLRQKAVRVESRHAARARRGHGLAVDRIGDVARREDAGHAGSRGSALGAAAYLDVA